MHSITALENHEQQRARYVAIREIRSVGLDLVRPYISIMAFIAVRLFGPIGGLITVGSYYFLEQKLGLWRALAASGVIGLVISYVVGMFILR